MSAGRAFPTMIRVGMAEALSYRAEFVIWMLTSTLPLVMLGLWTSVASDAPFGSYGSGQFVVYYLGALIVRNLTGNWVMWQLNDEIRRGALSLRLLRPLHPLLAYAATHLASIPLRALVALPFAIILLISTSRQLVVTDPVQWLILVGALAGAWALTFFTLTVIGCAAFFVERSLSIYEVYLGVFSILSGYLVPLTLLPEWVQDLADWTPFRYMLAFPVETMMGTYDRGEALQLLGMQWGFVALMATLALIGWQIGIRRYEAYGS